MIRVILSLIFVSLFSGVQIFAQQSGQLGSFDLLPQSVIANPALRPAGRVNIGFPGLSQVSFYHGNNWFKPSDYMVADANGKVRLEAEKILENIDEYAYTGQNLGIEIIHLGFRFGKHYVHTRISERVQVGLNIPKDIFYLGAYGNVGTHKFDNNTVNMSGLSVDAIHFREYGLGYNIELNDKWSFGLTAKYLYGMERVETEQSTIKLRTDPHNYNLQTSGSFIVNTSGLYSSESDGEEDIRNDIKSYLLDLKNTGFGGDLGVVYRPIEKLQLEFSANDIGFIKWKNNLATYGTNDASFAYNGIDLTDFIFIEGSDFNDAFDTRLDSLLDDLENTYKFERSEKEFTTSLNGYLRYGASYKVLSTEKFVGKAWLSVHHGILASEVPLSVSIGYNQKLWKAIQADIHFTKRAQFAPSFGAGISLNAGPFQIYCLAENMHFARYAKITLVDEDNPADESSFVYFENPQDVRINLGVNLTFGLNKEDSPGGRPMKR